MRRVADRLVLGPFPRRMRRGVLKAEKERFRMRPRDHLHRLVREQVGEIADAFYGREVLPEIRAAAAGRGAAGRIGRLVREVVDGAAQDAEELVEPVAVGTELRLPAEMPLPDERRVVAVRFEQRCDRRMLRRQSDVRRGARFQRLLQADGQPLRVPAGDVRAARRRADRRRRVVARELEALPRARPSSTGV